MLNIHAINGEPIGQKRIPKLLYLDIELAMMEISHRCYSLKQYSKFLPPTSVKRDVWMPCAAWKWLHQPFVASVSVLQDKERFKRDYSDDYVVVSTLHALISNADVIIGHNVKAFDWKHITTRFLVHGLDPIPAPQFIDTLKISRAHTAPASHSLRYLAENYDLGETKDEAPDWQGVAEGSEEAIFNCERYCRQDIRAGVALYYKLRPLIPNHPNLNLMHTERKWGCCPSCGSEDLRPGHMRHNQTRSVRRYQCRTCRSWTTEDKVIPKL